MSDAPRRNFPIARKLIAFAGKARRNWLERHRSPFSFWIHMVGIPVALGGLLAFAFAPWQWALTALAFGYLLQYVGHRVEGNDMGEWVAVKRLLGLPYVAVAPPRRPDSTPG